MLAGIWQNQWLEHHSPGSCSTVLLDGSRSDTTLLGSHLQSINCKRLVLAFQVFVSTGACLCSGRTGNIPPGTLHLCPSCPHVPVRVLSATSVVHGPSCTNPLKRRAASAHWRQSSSSKRRGSSHTGLLLVCLYLVYKRKNTVYQNV